MILGVVGAHGLCLGGIAEDGGGAHGDVSGAVEKTRDTTGRREVNEW